MSMFCFSFFYHFAKACARIYFEMALASWLYNRPLRQAPADGTRKKIVTIEVGGRFEHRRLPSRNIIKDLKKNLSRFDVLEDVILIEGRSSQETTCLPCA